MTRNPFKNYEEAKETYDLCNIEIDARAELNSIAMEQSKKSIKSALILAGVAIIVLFLISVLPFEALKVILGVIMVIVFVIGYYGYVMYLTILKPLGGLSALGVLWPDTSGIPDGVKDAVSSVSAGVMACVLESVPGGILVVLLFKPIVFCILLDIAIAFPPFVAILHIRRNYREVSYFRQIKGMAKQAMLRFEEGQSFCSKCGTRSE